MRGRINTAPNEIEDEPRASNNNDRERDPQLMRRARPLPETDIVSENLRSPSAIAPDSANLPSFAGGTLGAIYARYSTDGQRESSIADQVRRCREVASRLGIFVGDEMVFSDSAVTGKTVGQAKRLGYQRLLDAINARQCTVVIVDEVSRLTRSVAEGGRLMELVESTNLRFVTADGVDSDRGDWKLAWMFKLTTSTLEVDAAAHRTVRGMLGQLQRGYQIAQPPYGYRPIKDFTDGGRVLGTRWMLHEGESGVVREMYALRKSGSSGGQIAALLNKRGLPPPGNHRRDGAAHWRGTTVLRLLANPIYRAEFVWNGSSFTRHKAKKRGKPVVEVSFARPELRLVSDVDWWMANPNVDKLHTRTYKPRGGGKQLLSGLVRCGDCRALCVPGSGNGKGGLYCPQCATAVRDGGRSSWIGYTSVSAAEAALRWILDYVFASDAVRAAFQQRLEGRLRQGPRQEVERLKDELREAHARLERLKVLMADPRMNHQLFADDFEKWVKVESLLAARLVRAKAADREIDAKVVEVQKSADVSDLLAQLLAHVSVEPYKLKATLNRLLSRFEYVARPERGTSVFVIGVRPGVLVAEATGTRVLDSQEVAFEVAVKTTARRPVRWDIRCRPLEETGVSERHGD